MPALSSKVTVSANVPLLRDVAQRISDLRCSVAIQSTLGDGAELVWLTPYEIETLRKAEQVLNTLAAAVGDADSE